MINERNSLICKCMIEYKLKGIEESKTENIKYSHKLKNYFQNYIL